MKVGGLGAALPFLTLLAACSSEGGGSQGNGGVAPGFDRTRLLSSIADRAIVPTLTEFAARAADLDAATGALEVAVGTDAAAVRLDAARVAWVEAAQIWQRAEVMQVGPAAATSTGRTGAEGLRNEVHSWPADNHCAVARELIADRFGESGFFDGQLDNAYGLDALEFLLFLSASDARECPIQVVDGAAFEAFGESADFDGRRARYARAVAARLRADADRLLAAWTGGFRDQLAGAGQGGSSFASAQQALDELFAASYYLELQTNDIKLGAVAGLNGRCLAPTCPDLVESRWADASREFIRENVRGFVWLMHGGPPDDADAVGFLDYLGAAGADGLVQQLGTRLDAALAAAQDVTPPMLDALETERAEVEAQHAAISALMTLVETELVTDLALEIPREGAADND
jgi:predicted lipoprotein